MAGIELPKDAEGREIPLDVDALYDKSGNRVEVFRWYYVRGKDNNWTFTRAFEFVTALLHPQDYFLTPPDTWEKLEEDLDGCIEASDSCMYYSTTGICATCPRPDNDGCGCTAAIFNDIKKRIRKLRGERE